MYVLVGDPAISHVYIEHIQHAINSRWSVFPEGLDWLLG